MIAQTPTQTYTDLIYVIPTCSFSFSLLLPFSKASLSCYPCFRIFWILRSAPGGRGKKHVAVEGTLLLSHKKPIGHWTDVGTAFLAPTIFLFLLPEDTDHSTGDFLNRLVQFETRMPPSSNPPSWRGISLPASVKVISYPRIFYMEVISQLSPFSFFFLKPARMLEPAPPA
jgi:hypothetical protein